MKRFLACALAAISMVACVSEDVVQLPKSDAISFANAFIGNSTRAAVDPSTTEATLEAFDVWAYMTSVKGTVLEDEDVELNGDIWEYDNIQYWTPNKEFFFAALAPMNSDNWDLDASKATFGVGAGEVTFKNIDGGEDLIYATAFVTTQSQQTLLDKGMEPVKFQFQHLLSKVKFTFHNGFSTKNASIKVSNVTMTAPKEGTIDLGQGYDWELVPELPGSEPHKLEFYDAEVISKADGMPNQSECARERLTIPADAAYTYNIEFDVTLYYGEVEAYTVHKTSTVTGQELKRGYAYNFWTEINPENLELLEIVFEVERVDAWVDPYVDVEHPVVATINNEPYRSLQAAVDAATAKGGNSTIEVVSPVNELVTITQTTGVNLVINGNGNDYNGTIRVSGGSDDDATETLVIDGFNFKTNISGEACVNMNWGTKNQTRYAHNVTISNCTFTMVGAAVHTSKAIDCYQPYNITVKGCEVKNAHSLIQVKGGHNGVAVEDVKVVDCKNGIAFGTHDGPVSVKNAEIEALGYGVRADGSVATTLTIEDVTIEAIRPIVVRTASGNYNVVLAGTNTLTAGDYYQVIFTNGDDEATYVAPTGAYSITGADSFKVYPVNASDRVNTAAELTAKLADSSVSEIALESGAVIEGTFTVNRAVTIKSFDGNKATIKGRVNVSNANATFSNIIFDRNDTDSNYDWDSTLGSSNCLQYKAVVMIYGGMANNVKFDNCEFYNNGGTHKSAITCNSCGLTVDNCYFEGRSSAIYSQANLSITNSEFNYTGGNNVIASINGCGNDGGKFIFKNNNISGEKIFTLSQFLSTAAFGNGTYHFDVQGNTGAGFDYYFLNTGKVANKTFAAGSETF